MTIAEDAVAAALTFEGVKVSMIQNKDGYMLKLAIHPNEVPDELLRSYVGSRYSVVMVELNTDDTPKAPEKRRAAHRAVASAHLLCREPKFWDYLYDAGLSKGELVVDEEEARAMLCDYLKILSRRELATDQRAIDLFDGMKGEFEEWMKSS